jgi:hypothetical protein
MDLPIKSWLDEVLSHLALTGSLVQTGSPRKVLFWGDGVGGISSYVAGWMAGRGIDVILLDGANRFDPYMVSSYARKALIPPEKLLRRIRIARAFTCYQMATLMGERLVSLLRQEGVTDPPQRPWVIILGPLTTFFDEDVPEREVRPLFERSLGEVEKMAMEGIHFFLFQPSVSHENAPPFPVGPALGRDRGWQALNRAGPEPCWYRAGTGQAGTKGRLGRLIEPRRTYFARRLSQFSDLVWKVSLDDEGPKMILEKGLTKIADSRSQIAD